MTTGKLKTLKELHAEGWCDAAIAEVLGVARSTVRYWRTKLGLVRNYKWRKAME